MRGLVGGVLVLALLDAVVGSPQGPRNASGLLLGTSKVVAAFLSPTVPAFRRDKGAEPKATPSAVPGAVAPWPSRREPGLPFDTRQPVVNA